MIRALPSAKYSFGPKGLQYEEKSFLFSKFG